MLAPRTRLIAAIVAIFVPLVPAIAQPAIPFVVKDLYSLPTSPGGNYRPSALVELNGIAYFAADSSVNGRELWRTDGTDEGTWVVRDINPGSAASDPDTLFTFQSGLYFVAADGVHGRELWRTDGSVQGARMVADIYPGSLGSNPNNFAIAGPLLYFNADTGRGDKLAYVYDGTTLSVIGNSGACCSSSGACTVTPSGDCGTQGIWGGFGSSCAPNPCTQSVSVACCLPDKACVYADSSTCVALGGTSGSPNTTCGNCPDPALFSCCLSGGQCSLRTGLSCIIGGGSVRYLSTSCSPSPCDVPQQACCLPSGQCFMVGLVADCSAHAGTMRALPETCAAIGQTAAFCAQPALACCRRSGACVVIDPVGCRSSQDFIQPPGIACQTVACFAEDSVNPFASQVKMYAAGSRAVFLKSIAGVAQVWTSGGTSETTQRVAILPGTFDFAAAFAPFSARGRVYFPLDDGVHGLEMWETDGTAAGTYLIKDMSPGSLGGFVSSPLGFLQFVESNGALYFLGADASRRTQLWITDDTEAGTIMLSSSALQISDVYDLTPAPGGLYFTARSTINNQRRWWFTDGTPAGTHVVGPLGSVAGLGSGPFTHRIIRGNSILFNDRDASGELWSTNLLTGTTAQVFPIPYDAAHPDPRMWLGLHPTNLCSFQGRTFFAGDHQQPPTMLGNVLWTTDGTADGTTVALHLDGASPAAWGEMTAGSGNSLFFSAPAPNMGYELFTTDGSVAGTALVKDLNPGLLGSNPSMLTYRNGTLLFAGNVPGATQIVCRSDGTDEGTFSLGSLIPAETSGSNANHLTALNGQLYYFESTPQTGMELWQSDGTPQGTGIAVDLNPGPANGCSGSGSMVVHNGALYFSAPTGLYRSDGTPGGTTQLLATTGNILSGLKSSPAGLFFVGQNATLWRTDGTAAGTGPVSGTIPFNVDTLVPSAEYLYFLGQDSTHGKELWRTDGTAAGTQMVVDIVAGTTSSFVTDLLTIGSDAYFLAQGTIYTTNGSAAGTHPLLPSGSFTQLPTNLASANSMLFVAGYNSASGRRDLWRCEPPAGTLTLLTTDAFGYSFQKFTAAGPYLYFARLDFSNLRGLYRTDGTATGTILLTAAETWISDSGPFNFVAVGNDLYFSAYRSILGVELYHTVAPALGLQVLDIYPGGTGSEPGPVTAVGASIFLSARTQEHGRQLLIADSTPAGTHPVLVVNAAPTAVTPGIILAAADRFFYTPQSSAALYTTDGTRENTSFLADFNLFSGLAPLRGAAVGGSLYFNGNVAGAGVELCVSDGTIPGTHIVSDFVPGPDGCGPYNIAAIGNRVFYAGYSPVVSGLGAGIEPLVSDGSAAGTRRAGDVVTGSGDSYPSSFTDLHGLAIFVAGNGGPGIELYRSDGTPGGTYLLKDIYPGPLNSSPHDLVAAGNYVYFSADDGVHGRELWRTDGSTIGTVLVRDLCIGDLGSQPTNLTAAGDRLYFTAYAPETGVELWTSDGSASGTFMLFEVVPGPSSANIRSLTRAGDRLYFLATVPPRAPALWSFDWAGGLASGFTCAADYNRIAGLTIQDIFDYIYDWFAATSRADINGSGSVEVQDLFDYLNLWFAGC